MADVKWIKILTDIFDDEKFLLIESMSEADAIIVVWFKLLCLAGKQNNSGVFMLNDKIPYTDEMLATIFRRKPTVVKLALQTFEQFGMIEVVNGAVTIPNWEKHQQLDALERARESTRRRVAGYRERQRALAEGKKPEKNARNVTGDVTVTSGNADRIDKDKDKNKITNMRAHARGVVAVVDNPFSDDCGEANLDTVEAYVSSQLIAFGPKAMQELVSYMDDFPDDVIRHAVDEAVAAGVLNWKYVRGILNNYLNDGIRTMDDVRKAEIVHRAKAEPDDEPVKFFR